MKKVAKVWVAPAKHWVGNGFHVQSMFSYQDTDKHLDPFLLMDYNPPKIFQGGRQADSAFDLRGVEEHPHRGFETVTIAYQGEISHRDSHGGGGTIKAGDVQWMTAGSGVMHEEMHSENFAKTGGMFEMVQLWVNLPAKDKMTAPKYQAISAADIPTVTLADNAGTVRVIAGELQGLQGAASTFSPVNLWDTQLNAGGQAEFAVPSNHNLVILVLSGTVQIGHDATARTGELVTFERGGSLLHIDANNDAKLLILSGEPLNEPVVGYGPFVMNRKEEILQAIHDVQNGKFGRLA